MGNQWRDLRCSLGGKGRWILFGLLVLFCSVLPYPLYGEEVPKKKPDKESPITIEADHIEYYKDTDSYEAWGSVKITQDNAHLESDYATLDNRSGDALALGNVWYEDGDSTLIGEKIELNLNTKHGIIYKGKIFHRPDNYHIEGEEM